MESVKKERDLDVENDLEDRKQKEIEWADFRRSLKEENDQEKLNKYHANMKYYSINRRVMKFVEQWIRNNTKDKEVFEVACGVPGRIRFCADIAKRAVAADIAPESIEQAKENAKGHPHLSKVEYYALDCENTGMADNSFDVMLEGGALHHMDLPAAYYEAARLLREDGEYFCVEAIRHNPLIHLYRRMTPHLRTAWEVDHILGRKEVLQGLEYFHEIEMRHYHIAALLAVPFRKTPLFGPVLWTLERVDDVLCRIPGLKWLSWQCAFVLKKPRKDVVERIKKEKEKQSSEAA